MDVKYLLNAYDICKGSEIYSLFFFFFFFVINSFFFVFFHT